MSYSFSLTVRHEIDADGIVKAVVTPGEFVSGLPPEGTYSVNGHVHTGPDAGDAIGLVTPYGNLSATLYAPTGSQATMREDLVAKAAANSTAWAAQRGPEDSGLVEIVDEA